MRIDLSTIRKILAPFLTPASIFSAISIVLLVVINWDVLVLRHREFLEWAPGVSAAVAQVYSVVISLAMTILLYMAISGLLELAYFGPLKRLNKLEKETPAKISRLQGRCFCQSMLLGILAVDLTDSQSADLTELSDFIREKPDGPIKEGALQVLKQLTAVGESDSTSRLETSE